MRRAAPAAAASRSPEPGSTSLQFGNLHMDPSPSVWHRVAQVLNLGVAFLSDGTAAMRPDLHAATLLNVGFGVGRVLTCAQLRQELLAGASAAAQVEQARGKGG